MKDSLKFWLLFWFVLQIHSQSFRQFQKFKEQMEKNVAKVAAELQSQYVLKNNSPDFCNCTRKVYDQCIGTNALICYKNFPVHKQCPAGLKMSDRPAYVLAPDIKKNSLTCEQTAFICNTDAIDSVLQDVNKNRNKNYARIYVGSTTGILVSHPSSTKSIQSVCNKYDNRIRPWYNSASTGISNKILFLKIKHQQNLERAQDFISYLILTSNMNDQMMISDLNDVNTTFSSRMTQFFKRSLENYSNNLKVEDSSWEESDYDDFGQHSSDFFIKASTTNRNVIFLVTDSVPEEQKIREQLNNSYSPRFFPIIIGEQSSNLTPLTNMTNSFNGILIEDLDSARSIPNLMRPVANYFQQGLNIKKPIWSPIYLDAFEYGLLVTCSMPVYGSNMNENQIPEQILLGVVGLDVTLDFLQKDYNLTDLQIFSQFLSYEFYHSEVICDLNDCPPTQNSDYITKISNTKNIWKDKNQTHVGDYCCPYDPDPEEPPGPVPLPPEAIVGIVLGVLVLSLAIILAIVCIKRKKEEPRRINHPKANKPTLIRKEDV